ncbi:TonB-dependent receptor [Puia sp.]|uniref:TonB-dependent receptor n=1 Tax=Puia sp. TaxID=2045100 RepID=UPI002F41E726
MMRTLLNLLTVLLLGTFTYGQAPAGGKAPAGNTGRITGSVEDGAGKPLDGVSVSLLKRSDSSTARVAVTDKTGRFTLPNLPNGKYLLSFTHIGFTTSYSQPFVLSSANPQTTIPPIHLQPTDAALGQVTVVGRRPPIENKIDKTVVNVDASPTNGGLTALEVLEKSPGVMVDNDGNISLKGKQGVIILIDGKPTYLNATDLSNYLKNMSASQLDQIEIMSQPPAKYDAAGNSGVINLTTKKNKNNGFNGSITLSAIIARYFKTPNSINLNWRQGKFNIFGNYGYAWWEGFNDVLGNNSLRADANTPFDRYTLQHTYGRYSERGQNFRAGVDYFADKKTTFGIAVNGTIDKEWFTSESTTDFYDSLHQFVQYNVAQSLNKTPQTHLGFNGNFTRKLDGKGSELTADADYIFFNTQGTINSNNYLYNADNIASDAPYLLNGRLPSKIDIYTFKSDYKKVISDATTIEAGIKTSFVRTDNNAIYTLYDNSAKSWVADTAISNHFIYKENINAAYVNWQQKIKKFSWQLGLRAEQTNTNGDQTVKSVSFKKNYIQLFPTAYLNYKTNDNNTFGLSFGRRIERPSYQSLNPYRFQLDRYTYEQGNPNLQPQFSNNVELSYNYKGALNISANYTMTTDIISDAVISFKAAGDSNYTTYQTSQNIASQRNIGLSLNYSKQLAKGWNLNVFFNVYNNHYKGVVDSTIIDVSYTSFNASFNSQYAFKKGWAAEISGFYYAKNYVSGVLLAEGRGMFSLGGSKQICNGKGSLKLNLRDPFYLMNFTSHTHLDKGLTNSHSIWDNRRIVMTFIYRFGKNSGNQPQRRNGGAGDEQSRVGGNSQQ